MYPNNLDCFIQLLAVDQVKFYASFCGLKGPLVKGQKVWLPVGQMGKFGGLFKQVSGVHQCEL